MKKDMEKNNWRTGSESSLFRGMPLPICLSAGIGKEKVDQPEKQSPLRFPPHITEVHKRLNYFDPSIRPDTSSKAVSLWRLN